MELSMSAKSSIKRARYMLGMSQREFAEFVDINKSTLSLYETGQRSPGFANIRKIVDKVKAKNVTGSHLEYTDLVREEDLE